MSIMTKAMIGTLTAVLIARRKDVARTLDHLA
jgi:hypothetical protein